MYIDPVRHPDVPQMTASLREMAIYDELERQGISFERVDHDHADTMEDCRKIEGGAGRKDLQNLFCATGSRLNFIF